MAEQTGKWLYECWRAAFNFQFAKYCILDIFRNLPCSTLSEKQHGLILWGICSLGISNVPSENTVKSVIDSIQYMCGVRTIRYKEALGHVYYVNDLCALIAQVTLFVCRKFRAVVIVELRNLQIPKSADFSNSILRMREIFFSTLTRVDAGCMSLMRVF